MTVDATSVYWGGQIVLDGGISVGRILKCATTGCNNAPTSIGTLQGGTLGDLANDGSFVYWALSGVSQAGGGVFQCNNQGCGTTPTTLVAGGYISVMALGGASVYFMSTIRRTLQGCSTISCANSPTILVSAGGTGMAVDSAMVYWADQTGGAVAKCAEQGCATATYLAQNQSGPARVAVDDTSVYWTNQTGGTVMKCAKTGCNGAPSVLASSQSSPYSIAVDVTNVYFTDTGSNQVMACAVGGCGAKPTVLATGQASLAAIAVDSAHVYWMTSTTIVKVAKP